MSLVAGAARCETTPRVPCHLAGYGARNRPHDAVHSPLFVRALYLKDADGGELLLASADVLWYGNDGAGRTRQELAVQLKLPPERVFLAGTHSHSAPATTWGHAEPAWIQLLAAQTVAAAALAKSRAVPASVRWARGVSRIGINRRERTPEGRIVLGRNPAGPCDRELIGLAVDETTGTPIARLANFACHGVVFGQDSYRVSGDWPGLAAASLEADHGGAPFLFFQGGSGNVNPRVGPQSDPEPVAGLAAEFAADFRTLAGLWRPLGSGNLRLAGATRPVMLPTKDRGVDRQATIRGVAVGPLQIVGFPGEVFSETAVAVKQTAAGPAWVCSYVDGSEDGYVPVAEAYPEGGYEVEVSPYGPGGEAALRSALIELLGKL